MQRLTLEWQEENRNCSQTLSLQDQTKFPRSIRIGRDRDRCDVILQHPDPNIARTVSGLHLELFWNDQVQQFYIRNLTRDRTPPNPAIVNGQTVITQEVPIAENCQIKLGKLTLRVKVLDLNLQNTQQIGIANTTSRFVCKCTNPKGAHLLPADYALLTCHCGYQVLGASVIYDGN
ncbi:MULTISPECIES: FHA domain-containing protein [unclassified Leptolyngbya]|uniref:FHA domain-containing protein n=1 Tax=unclassified Leptolyngbya TaxID=2650499 RepID=UPI001AD44988|nr:MULTISPECIES: FHA domain-containing protein [unclassified Leptolyngbya]MBN8564829.1 FHA domain-containing protein [Leptolyngbya sp. UWPOB_LEPTO1]MCY6494432.1 FHA domain-containing protein [Leptolyngbya sp. GGD]